MPYPYHADQHQYHNARQLADREAAIVLEDRKSASANAASLAAELLPLLEQPDQLARMQRAARPTARRAGIDVAHSLLKLADLKSVHSSTVSDSIEKQGFTLR